MVTTRAGGLLRHRRALISAVALWSMPLCSHAPRCSLRWALSVVLQSPGRCAASGIAERLRGAESPLTALSLHQPPSACCPRATPSEGLACCGSASVHTCPLADPQHARGCAYQCSLPDAYWAARSPAAPTWLGLSPCALPPGLLLRAARRMLGAQHSQFPNGASNTLSSRGGIRNLPRTPPPSAGAYRCPVLFYYFCGGVFSPFGLGADVAASGGPLAPAEFRACGAPVPTLRRSPPLRGRAVVSFFVGWRRERLLGGNGWR